MTQANIILKQIWKNLSSINDAYFTQNINVRKIKYDVWIQLKGV